MSFDDHFADIMLPQLFDTFGVDATVQRGAAAPQPVRIIVNRNVPRYGDYGQVVGTSTVVDMQLAQWHPQQGDVLAWTDRLGAHNKTISAEIDGDGMVAKAVLHG